MHSQVVNRSLLRRILSIQEKTITVGEIYRRVASKIHDPHDRNVLREIAGEEMEHYKFWKEYSATDVSPDRVQVLITSLFLRVLGYTFTLKLLASRHARCVSWTVINAIPGAETVLRKDEEHNEQIVTLADTLDEERFHYMGAIVLGMNDAIVEFVGTLAGLTFALQNSQIIAITGIVAGISASLSMAASEYFSQKSEADLDRKLNPLKAAVYTGVSYMATVALLLLPFLLMKSPYAALPLMLAVALVILFGFSFYLSVAEGLNFRKRFVEMALVSLGIALLSFVIGLGVRSVLHVTI